MAFLDETGLAELWSLIQAEDAKLAAADVKIATGSYTGTGTYGSSNPNSLTFDFVPKLVIVKADVNGFSMSRVPLVLIKGCTYCGYWLGSSGYDITAAWSDNGVSWYNTQNATYQLNNLNSTHRYIAIGKKGE